MARSAVLKFLVPVWGAPYIEQFCETSLRTLLAPGNLPYVNSHFDLEIVFLTDEHGKELLQENSYYLCLENTFKVGYIDISDLLPGGNIYMSLTFAYGRAIQAFLNKVNDVTFVFFNSDFFLSNNSLQSLVREINSGAKVVYAPSLRVSSEYFLPRVLDGVLSSDETIGLDSKSLANISFDTLHPTTLSKFLSQDFIHATSYNQLYWRVDNKTVVGRAYLMFMLAISPTNKIFEVNSYCDYGFVPSLAPNSKVAVLADSDDFLMIELQDLRHEFNSISFGKYKIRNISEDLGVWTTRDHRNNAGELFIIKGGALPSSLDTSLKRFDKVHTQIVKHMRTTPASSLNHPYWNSPYQKWISERTNSVFQTTVVPVDEKFFLSFYHKVLFFLHKFFSQPIKPPIINPNWFEFRMLNRELFSLNTATLVLVPFDVPPREQSFFGQNIFFCNYVSNILDLTPMEQDEVFKSFSSNHEKVVFFGANEGSWDIIEKLAKHIDAKNTFSELVFIFSNYLDLNLSKNANISLTPNFLNRLNLFFVKHEVRVSTTKKWGLQRLATLQSRIARRGFPNAIREIPKLASIAGFWLILSSLVAVLNVLIYFRLLPRGSVVDVLQIRVVKDF
jgi:hypothetical protein